MKRLYVVILSVMLFASSFAQTDDNAISMVSYEQSWLDFDGTLALKNNTDKDIHNVSFRITYLDMSGNALDYEDFTRKVEIAPGMTKKIDIPAYELGRHYHYYKSENKPGGSPSFKVKFEMKGYNTAITQDKEDEDLSDILNPYSDEGEESGMSDFTGTLVGLLIILFVVGAWIGMYIIVAVMAQRRNRSVVMWVLLSMIASPLLMMIILLVVGKDNNRFDRFDR